MRDAKHEWIVALRALTGQEGDTIRWNMEVGRWEFVLTEADGVKRSQFWGWFNRPIDRVSGLYPFRDLDDDALLEALGNLERTFVANRHDGAGSNRREVLKRMRYNRELKRRQFKTAGEAFADMAAERGHRLRGAPLIHVPAHLGVGKYATREERSA